MKCVVRIVFAGVLILVTSCSGESRISVETEAKPENKLIPTAWKERGIKKVVGFRFKIPREDSEGNHSTGYFTLCRGSVVDLATLEAIQTGKSVLDAAQVETLLDCVFSAGDPLPRVACYSPHQLFIFYDAGGKAKRAIEVCFLCNGISAIPPLSEEQKRKHDLMKLARLCNELGIWSDYKKIEDYVPIFSEGWTPE